MDKALKQRLVGASVMIALAVVVLPMLLSGRPDGDAQQAKKIELQSRPDDLSFETRRFPVSDMPSEAEAAQQQAENQREQRQPLPSAPLVETSDQNSSSAEEQTIPDVEVDETPVTVSEEDSTGSADNPDAPALEDTSARAVDITPLQPKTEAEEAKAPQPTSKAPAASGAAQGRYVVQVASLGSSENASRLVADLQKQGFPVLVDTVKSDVGSLTRVRVGPYARESEATEVSSRIKKDFKGTSPRVVDIKPGQAATVTNPADPLVRWVVQVGSFGEAANADRLVTQLRAEGLTAYREAVSSKSSTVYRVRVGPFLEREDALKAEKLLADSHKIDGVVMSAD